MNTVSHFARAGESQNGAAEKQFDIFSTFCEDKPGQHPVAASGDILLWPQSRFNWTRPGITLCGVSPLESGTIRAGFGCQPVMSSTSNLIAIHEHRVGEPVGYGGTWVNECDARLGVVAMGYGDDYPHAAPSGTPVLVNSCKVSIAEQVAVGTIYVDLGPWAQDEAGDPVIL